MKLTRDELISIVSDVTTLLGQVLAQHVELQESLVGGGAGVERQKMKLNALKAKLAGEKLKLDKLNATAKRKKELEKANKRSADRTTANEGKQSRVALYNNKGALIGWLSYEAGGKVTVYDSGGRLVARELAGVLVRRLWRRWHRSFDPRPSSVGTGNSLRGSSTDRMFDPRWGARRHFP